MGDLKKQGEIIEETSAGEEFTFGKLSEDNERFQTEYKGNGKKATFSNSTLKECVIVENKDVSVLAKWHPPESHLMERFMNHVFFDGLVKTIGHELYMVWPKNLI